MDQAKVCELYPLHHLVWKDDAAELEKLLSSGKQQSQLDLEAHDPHQRTPLLLAICLNRDTCVQALLASGASVVNATRNNWSAVDEATSTTNESLLRLVLATRDQQAQKFNHRVLMQHMKKLASSPDFYFEIKWDFNTWLPLLSAISMSDVSRVWKKGSSLRIDANQIGFHSHQPSLTALMSYIFTLHSGEDRVTVQEINHSTRTVYLHEQDTSSASSCSSAPSGHTFLDSEEMSHLVAKKLQTPILVTYYLLKGGSKMEKCKAGSFWSRFGDLHEVVNKRTCQVFQNRELQLATLRRTEHMTDSMLQEYTNGANPWSAGEDNSASVGLFATGLKNPLTNLLSSGKKKEQSQQQSPRVNSTDIGDIYNPSGIPEEQYFQGQASSDIGRCKAMYTKVKTFRARFCLTDEVNLSDELFQVIEIMALYNPFYRKLSQFKLPQQQQTTGKFPMRIEIPLYIALNATLTIGNLQGEDGHAQGVECSSSEMNLSSGSSVDSTTKPLLVNGSPKKLLGQCKIDDSVFKIPVGFRVKKDQYVMSVDETDAQVQLAMIRSLDEFGGPDQLINRQFSLVNHKVASQASVEMLDVDEASMQEAIAASLEHVTCSSELPSGLSDEDKRKILAERQKLEEEELKLALELSKKCH